jgi:transposase
MRSKIEPMKNVARTLREHCPLLVNWFRAKGKISNAAVEALNNKAKTTLEKSYGFGRVEVLKVALYRTLGELPLPHVTHKFCGRRPIPFGGSSGGGGQHPGAQAGRLAADHYQRS